MQTNTAKILQTTMFRFKMYMLIYGPGLQQLLLIVLMMIDLSE